MSYSKTTDVTTAVAIMARTVQSTAKQAILEIDINTSDEEEERVLIKEYVKSALGRKLFPEVAVKGSVLERNQLHRELRAIDEKFNLSLASEYKKMMGAQTPSRALKGGSVFLTSAGAKIPKTSQSELGFLAPKDPNRQRTKAVRPIPLNYPTTPKKA